MIKFTRKHGVGFVAALAGMVGGSMMGQAQVKSETADKTWIEDAACIMDSPLVRHAAMPKKNIQIIGVDIGPGGEFVRLEPKPEILKGIQDNFIFGAQHAFVAGLSREDFRPLPGLWPDSFKTPLDISSLEMAGIVYVLLPESWTFSETPMSMKVPATRGKYPAMQMPAEAHNPKVAVMYFQGRDTPETKHCRYEYNLHVTISQENNGQKMVTDIIIDPGGDNNPTPPYDDPP